MTRSRITRLCTLLALVACNEAGETPVGIADEGPRAMHGVHTDLAVAAAVEVTLKSQNTIGTRPDGSTVLIDIKVDASGATASALAGTGRHFGSGGLHAYWDVSGEIAGNSLTLRGSVREASDPVFVGSPIEITADLASEVVTFAFGPLTGGRFAGHTIVTQGAAKIVVRQ